MTVTGMDALAELARLETAKVYGAVTVEYRQPTITQLDQERYDELAARRARRAVPTSAPTAALATRPATAGTS